MLANAVKRAGANLQRRIVLLQQFVCRPFGPESDARSCYPRGSLFPHTTPRAMASLVVARSPLAFARRPSPASVAPLGARAAPRRGPPRGVRGLPSSARWRRAALSRSSRSVVARLPARSAAFLPGSSPRLLVAPRRAPRAPRAAATAAGASSSTAASRSDPGGSRGPPPQHPGGTPDPTAKLLVACVIGLGVGLGVSLFNIAEHEVHDLVFTSAASSPERYTVEGARDIRPASALEAAVAIAAPTAAGFACTALRRLAGGFDGEDPLDSPTASDDVSDERSKKNVFGEDVFRTRGGKSTLKALAAVVTLGSGSSLGPEGPSVEIGAAVAGSVADVAGVRAPFDDSDSNDSAANADNNTDSSDAASRRLGLIAAGSAAGISAGFGAPIAGLFFAFESILQPASARASAGLGGSTGFGQLTTESVILSSVLAAVVSSVLLGDQPAFVVPAFELKNVAELPLYLPLGLACGAVAVAFRASSRVLGAGFKRLENPPNTFSTSSSDGAFVGYPRVPRAWHAPLGGFVFGVASLLFPEVTYQGFDNVNSMLGADGGGLRTPYPPTLLLELVLAKLAATTLCRQSGLVGGVYAPSLFMGAALGSAYGALLTPVAVATGAAGLGAVAPPQAYALVGMAGVLAGVCRVPLTAILLLFELTGDYRIIVPLMGTVGVASWVAGAADREEERAKEREKQLEAAKGAAGGGVSSLSAESYAAVEVPTGRSEGVVGAGLSAVARLAELTASRDEGEQQLSTSQSGESSRYDDAPLRLAAGLRRGMVADATRRDVPRVPSTAGALEAAEAAAGGRFGGGGGVGTSGGASDAGPRCCCALVVDARDGSSTLGVVTAESLARALGESSGAGGAGPRGAGPLAAEAVDKRVPTVRLSASLHDAAEAMARAGVGVAVVVAGDATRDAVGVVTARGAEAEAEAAALAEAIEAARKREEATTETRS